MLNQVLSSKYAFTETELKFWSKFVYQTVCYKNISEALQDYRYMSKALRRGWKQPGGTRNFLVLLCKSATDISIFGSTLVSIFILTLLKICCLLLQTSGISMVVLIDCFTWIKGTEITMRLVFNATPSDQKNTWKVYYSYCFRNIYISTVTTVGEDVKWLDIRAENLLVTIWLLVAIIN